MLLNCGAGEDSWESLGLQRDQTSQFLRRSTLNIHWKDWCWCRSSNTLATWCEEPAHWEKKKPWCWEDWKQKEKGTAEDEMVRQHHWLKGCEFKETLGDSGGQGAWCAAAHGVIKGWTWLSNWTTRYLTNTSDYIVLYCNRFIIVFTQIIHY